MGENDILREGQYYLSFRPKRSEAEKSPTLFDNVPPLILPLNQREKLVGGMRHRKFYMLADYKNHLGVSREI